MKKLFLTLIALVTTSLASFAQSSLHEAYLSLSDIPGMKVKNDMTLQLNGVADINEARTSTATTKTNADKLRGEFTEIIESMPEGQIIVNASNPSEFATVLAEPGERNLYNVLILQGDAITGIFSATYGTTTADDVKAIGNCNISLKGNDLVLTPVSSTSGHYITMTE